VVRALETEELRSPHLVLADLRGEEHVVAAGDLRLEAFERILRLDDLVVLLVTQAVALAPLVDLTPPPFDRAVIRLPAARRPAPPDCLDCLARVRHDRHIDHDILVDRGRVDVDMHLLRIRGEAGEEAGHAVVEPRADGEDEVRAVHGEIGLVEAVHAEHPDGLRMRGRKGAEPHQRLRAGEAGLLHQATQPARRGRSRIDDAAADIHHRPFRGLDERHGFFHRLRLGARARLVAPVLHLFRRPVGAGGELHVLRHIHHHRPRPAAARDIERLMNRGSDFVHAPDEVVVLGAGPGDAGRVRFLEGVIADEVRRHLAGQADDGNAVHERVGEAGHRIGRAGPGGHEHDADLAGRAGIAFRGMDRAAFLADEVMAQLVLLEDLVIDRQHGAARIAEDRLDTLIDEGFDDHFGAVHGPGGHGPVFRVS